MSSISKTDDCFKQLQASKFDVGVRLNESTIHSMASFREEVSLTINLKERAIFIYFRCMVRISPTKRTSITGSLCRVKFPLFRLARIWKMTNDASKEVSFLIILDCPAAFHRQLPHFGPAFQNDISWRDSDTWYRQTSIAKDPFAQRLLATNLQQSEQIIDIGEPFFAHIIC